MGCSLSLSPSLCLLPYLSPLGMEKGKDEKLVSRFQGQNKGGLFFQLVFRVLLSLSSWTKEASSLTLCVAEKMKGMFASHRPSLKVLGTAYCEQNTNRYLCFYTCEIQLEDETRTVNFREQWRSPETNVEGGERGGSLKGPTQVIVNAGPCRISTSKRCL